MFEYVESGFNFLEEKGFGCVRCVRKVFEKSEGRKPFWERENQGFELFQQSIILILYLKIINCLMESKNGFCEAVRVSHGLNW